VISSGPDPVRGRDGVAGLRKCAAPECVGLGADANLEGDEEGVVCSESSCCVYSDSSSWMTYSGEGIRGRCEWPWWRRPREREERLGVGAWITGADLEEVE